MGLFSTQIVNLCHVMGLKGNQPGTCRALRGMISRQAEEGSQAKGRCPILQVNKTRDPLCSHSLQSLRKSLGS